LTPELYAVQDLGDTVQGWKMVVMRRLENVRGKSGEVKLPYYINKKAYAPLKIKPLQVITHQLDEDMVTKILLSVN
jgi:hypothetical protein